MGGLQFLQSFDFYEKSLSGSSLFSHDRVVLFIYLSFGFYCFCEHDFSPFLP